MADPTGSNAENVTISRKEWQDLHSREFENRIFERLSGRTNRIAAGFGVTGFAAVITAFLAIWGPFQDIITEKITNGSKARIDEALAANRALIDERLKDAQQVVRERLTGEVVESVRRAAVAQAGTSAVEQVRSQLADRGSPIHQAFLLEIRPLVTAAMIEDFTGRFRTAGETAQQAMAFDALRRLDPERARRELSELIRERGDPPSPLPQRSDLVIAGALRSLARATAGESLESQRAVQLSTHRDLALQVTRLVEAIWQAPSREPDPIAQELLAATSAWFATLGPEDEVAGWFYSRAGDGRMPRGHHPVMWDLLLRDGRAASLTRLMQLIRDGEPAEVEGILRALAATRWPRLRPAAALRLLAQFEARAPQALLSLPKLTPAALEARWALSQAVPRGATAARFAWDIWGRPARDAAIPDWMEPLQAYQRLTVSRARAGAAAAIPPDLSLASLAPGHWPALLTGLLGSVAAEDAAEFTELLFQSTEAQLSAEDGLRRDRRLALLAFTLAAAPAGAIPAAPPLLARVLAELLASPRLDTAAELGGALQRVLPLADGPGCVATPARPGHWSQMALLGCPGGTGAARLDLLARALEAAPAGQRQRLLALWLLSVPARGDFAAPLGDSRDALAGRVAAALRLGGEGLEAPGALALLAVMRPMDAAAIDTALERRGGFRLYPAPPGTADGVLPVWSDPAWWAQRGGPTRPLPAEGETRWSAEVQAGPPTRLAILCSASYSTRLQLAPLGDRSTEGMSVLVVPADAPAALREGDQVRNVLAAPLGCTGDRLVRVVAPDKTQMTLVREPPVHPARFARDFASRAEQPPLAVGQPVLVELGAGEAAFFRLAVTPDRNYELRTRNLADGTDTILTVLDGEGQDIAEDDDGGQGLESRLLIGAEEVEQMAALRIRLLNEGPGSFEFLVEDAGADPLVELRPDAPRALRLPKRGVARMVANLEAGRGFLLRTEELQPGVDTTVAVRASGVELGQNDDIASGNLASELAFTPRVTGPHRIILRNIGEAGGFSVRLTARTP